jgi:hypothetical protein
MIKSLIVAMVGLSFLAVSSRAQSPLSLNFANTPLSTIQFNGVASSFQFNSSLLAGPYFGS